MSATAARLFIAAAIIASAASAQAKSKITPDQRAIYTMFMEAKTAEKFCTADKIKVNAEFFEKQFKTIPTLSDKEVGAIFVETLNGHKAAIEANPDSWCSDYKNHLRDSWTWSADAPAIIGG